MATLDTPMIEVGLRDDTSPTWEERTRSVSRGLLRDHLIRTSGSSSDPVDRALYLAATLPLPPKAGLAEIVEAAQRAVAEANHVPHLMIIVGAALVLNSPALNGH